MWKKIAVAGSTAAVILGAGTAALAASGNDTTGVVPAANSSTSASATTTPSHSAASGSSGKGRQRGPAIAQGRLKRALHASWVTKGENATFVTHAAIRGAVTAVSATSISVKAADNVTQTYTVNSSTKVHTRADKKAAPITDVKSGDPVLVVGTGTSSLTATQVVDAKK
ncbi:MAG: hypothetical protein JWN95_3235 [Frankiales bacterium]|nr:hypothetical protein [Frankiales bacterium]